MLDRLVVAHGSPHFEVALVLLNSHSIFPPRSGPPPLSGDWF